MSADSVASAHLLFSIDSADAGGRGGGGLSAKHKECTLKAVNCNVFVFSWAHLSVFFFISRMFFSTCISVLSSTRELREGLPT